MAYDYNKAKEAYESLNEQQRQQFVEQNKNDANFQRFAKEYTNEKFGGTTTSSPTTTVASPKYENQGSGNYVYNEKTGYYENQTDTSRNTTNQGLAPRPENVKTETPIRQGEIAGQTVLEVKQEGALKPLSQEYYNQTSEAAQNTIRDNLNRYKQTNPEYFTDYESFKKNFSYNTRSDEQKNTLDTRYKGYQESLTLATTPTTDLYTQYQNGNLSAAQIEGLRISDPTKYAELQNQINKGNIIAAYDDDKGSTGLNIQEMAYQMLQQSFMAFMNGGSDSGASQYFRDYEEKMESPEMKDLSDQCTELQNQIENVQADLDSIKKSVEKEYEGTGASRAKINAIISDRSYDLQLQLRTLNSEYNKYATQYNNRMQQYQNEFNLQLQEYQLAQNERQVQMKELGFAMDLMNFETNDQKAEREWNYWVKQQEYTNGDINSKDYSTRYKAAIKSVQNLLSQYEGIPMERSAEQMAQDVLKAIDNGSDLGTELTKINKLIQQKPEYQYLYNNTYGKTSGLGTTKTIGGIDYVEYNGKLYTASEFNQKYGGQPKAYNQVSEDVFKWYSDGRAGTFGSFFSKSKNEDGNYGGQCGKYVNDYLVEIGVTDSAHRYYDNELSTKLNSINTQIPKKGAIAVFDYNHESASDGINHGHVGIVVDVLNDGRIVVQDSNFGSDEKIQQRIIDPSKDTALKGYFDPSRPATGSSSTLGGGSNTLTSTTNTLATNTDGTLSDASITQLAKDMINNEKEYSEIKAAYGEDTLKKIENRALELRAGGYEKSTIITDPTKQANMESKLRSEYDKAVADAQETIDWVNKMQEAYNVIDTDKNAASQAIVIAYNKILDPGSIVREGEYARSAQGQSALKQLQAKMEQIVNGGAGLTKDELASMIKVGEKFSQNAIKTQNDAAQRAKVSIDKYGLTPEAVLPTSLVDQLYGTTTNQSTPQNWYTQYQSKTPAGTTNISVGNGLSITRP